MYTASTINSLVNTGFNIQVKWLGLTVNAEVRPCCKAGDAIDYTIWSGGKFQFTINKDNITGRWIIALIDADKQTHDDFIQAIGQQIDNTINN